MKSEMVLSVSNLVINSVSWSLFLIFCILNRFLRLLSEYDWAFSPLIVDFDGDFSTEEKNKINVSTKPNDPSLEGVPCSYLVFPCIFFYNSEYYLHMKFDRRIS